MTKKKEAAAPGLFPDHYEPDKLYTVLVKKQFEHARSQVRPGKQRLRGDLVEQYREFLTAAWLE